MREILFRGQIRKKGERVTIFGEPLDGKWIYGGIFASNTKSDRCIITSYDDFKKYPVHADTVGQFTGLTDRNDVKIFEGDILKYFGEIFFVEYDERSARFLVKKPNGAFIPTVFNDCEIVGNIYDTPELLKGV